MRLGLVGHGQTAGPYARRFAELPGVDIIATTGTRAPDGVSSPHQFDDAVSMYERTSLDAVCVSTLPDRRRPAITEAIERGLAVFCPGPLASSIDDGGAIVDVARASDGLFLGGYGTRFAPEYSRAETRVAEGAIGRVGNARTTRDVPAASTPGEEYAVLGYDVEFLRHVCGPIERVFARRASTNNACYLATTLRFPGDIVGQLDVRIRDSADTPAGSSSRWTAGVRRFEIAGVDGLLEFDSETVAPVVVDTAAGHRREVPLARDGLQRHIEAFVNRVRGDGEPGCPVDDAFETLRVCTAARVSADAGEPVTPTEVGQ